MITPHIAGGAFGAAIVAALWAALPSPAYYKVHDMRVIGSNAVIESTIRRPVVADWRVTVVRSGEDGPSCSTIPGPREHEGWSHYEPRPRTEKTFPVDIWVGDPGCWDRLRPGEHLMYVTWTPRDGTGPVTAQAKFSKPQEGEG